ncbi:MAG TPA: zinc ribbon domain-containing protein [Pyrinomonadaceae bacterium]|jgi:hypothetical protein
MYCPQCATENLDNASFCRGCGANISLVSQALTGSVPAAPKPTEWDEYFSHKRQRSKEQPSIEKGIKNIFMGVAFLLASLGALKYAPNGHNWWFWLLIPAFFMLGGGVAEIVRFKMRKNVALPDASLPAERLSPPSLGPFISTAGPTRPAALPRRNTAELMPPPSVTEGTTRHLDDEMQTKHLETPVERKPK